MHDIDGDFFRRTYYSAINYVRYTLDTTYRSAV